MANKKDPSLKKVTTYGEKTPATNENLLKAYKEIYFKYAMNGCTMLPVKQIEKNLSNVSV